jgi:LytS/YehU family sensor histidine kinase
LSIAATLGFISLILLYLFARQRRQQFLQEKQQQAAEMKNQTLQLELKALRAQMNPHFIFNCMNTIDAYILRQQPMEASGILQKFSKLIRNVLENSELQLIPLTQDADTNRNYIDLEQTIYKHKFVYELIVDEALKQNPPLIPPMLVQPFIENAILHGLRHLPNGNGHLLVHYKKVNGHVEIVIEDNGIGRTKSGTLQKLHSNSMGMQVTESRLNALKELHGIDLQVKVEDAFDSPIQPGTRATLQL